jgi:hypothetical protein
MSLEPTKKEVEQMLLLAETTSKDGLQLKTLAEKPIEWERTPVDFTRTYINSACEAYIFSLTQKGYEMFCIQTEWDVHTGHNTFGYFVKYREVTTEQLEPQILIERVIEILGIKPVPHFFGKKQILYISFRRITYSHKEPLHIDPLEMAYAICEGSLRISIRDRVVVRDIIPTGLFILTSIQ